MIYLLKDQGGKGRALRLKEAEYSQTLVLVKLVTLE
jgi:hypothetical protein